MWQKAGGELFSPGVARAFTVVAAWSTHYRYVPGVIDLKIVVEFVNACENFLRWANERIDHG
jgi:hypothetical protein